MAASSAQTQTGDESDGDLVSEIGSDLEIVVNRWEAGQIGVGDLVVAAGVVAGAAVLAWLVRRLLARAAARTAGPAAAAATVGGQLLSAGILLFAAGVVLEILGFTLGPILVLVLIVVIAVLLMQPLLLNLSAGLLLQVRSPFVPGDVIETDDIVGIVDEVNARTVVVVTSDGRTAHVTNREVLERRMVNYSTLGRRRSTLELRLAADVGLDDALTAVERAVGEAGHVLEDPPPEVLATGFEGSLAKVEVRFWHPPPLAAEHLARDRVARAVVERLGEQGFTLTDHTVLVGAVEPGGPTPRDR